MARKRKEVPAVMHELMYIHTRKDRGRTLFGTDYAELMAKAAEVAVQSAAAERERKQAARA